MTDDLSKLLGINSNNRLINESTICDYSCTGVNCIKVYTFFNQMSYFINSYSYFVK